MVLRRRGCGVGCGCVYEAEIVGGGPDGSDGRSAAELRRTGPWSRGG